MADRPDPSQPAPTTPDGANDPEGAHDVLAAEEFAMPAPDPELHREPVVLPDDPSGDTEPHDVLAAESFPLPAGRPAPRSSSAIAQRRGGWPRLALEALVGLLFARALIRRRRG